MSDRHLPPIAQLYAQRWPIETLFGAFKSGGFQRESGRVNQHQRIRILLVGLAIGLGWAMRTGDWLLDAGRPLTLKRLKEVIRQLLGLLRRGLDEWPDRLLNHRAINDVIPLLSCT